MVKSRTLILLISISVIGLLTSFSFASDQLQSVDVIAKLIDVAEDGSTVTIPKGIYQGNLVVSKPITLLANGDVVIDALGNGTVIELRAEGITLRGFTVRGSGSSVDHEPAGVRVFAGPVVIENNRFEDVYFGIDLRQSPKTIIRNNHLVGKDLELGRRGDGIRLWWSHGCVIQDNTAIDLRDMVFWYSENLIIEGNNVSQSRYGLHFMYSHNTVMSENELSDNSVGIYLMYSNNITLKHNRVVNNRGSSGYGIGLKDCDDIVIQDNALLANRVGVYIDNSPSSVDAVGLITRNSLSFNEIGLLATPITHDNVITENAFIENEEQVTVHGGGQLTLNSFELDGRGNFWSDYAGFDLVNDGIGDLPHAPRSLFRNLLAREPNLRIFVHSPAQQAIELTARAFPDLSPQPMFSDPSPLSSVPTLQLMSSSDSTNPWPMAALSVGLLLTSFAAGWLIMYTPVESQTQRPRQQRRADA
jgi:nitrous oxide reductase family maturation protein NosD